jgi:hypothetical protein
MLPERLLFDRRQAAGDVALRRLRVRKIAGLVAVDHLLVAIEHPHEFGAYFFVAAARCDNAFAAGQLGRLAEYERAAGGVEFVERVADRRIGTAAGRGVRFAALARNPQVVQRAFGALLLARPLQKLTRGRRCAPDRVVVAVKLDAEALHRFPGRCDAVDDTLRPLIFDADHHNGGDVGIAAGADQRAKVQLEIRAKLQPAVGMRNCQRAFDVVRDRFGGGIGKIVDG